MKYFVTGATGFVGGVLTRRLCKDGHEVNALVRNPESTNDLRNLGAQIFKGDITDKESMREGMTSVDGVFHVAGWYKVGTKVKGIGEKINIQGTQNVLELMQELEIPRGVYTSTLSVNSHTKGIPVDEGYHFHGRHISEYDRTKAIAHDIADEFIANGLPLMIVQPGLIYGPGDTSSVRENLLALFEGKLPAVPTQFLGCWAHIDDIVEGHILAMEKGKPGETYIIGGEPVKFYDVFKLAAQVSRKRVPLKIPYQIFRIMSMLAKPFDSVLPPTYTSESLRVYSGTTYWGDDSKAKRELGYKPRPFREGWTETVRYEMSLLGIK